MTNTFTSRRMTPGILPYCPLPPRAAGPRRQRRQPLPEHVPVRRSPLAWPRQELDLVVLDGTVAAAPRNVLDTVSAAIILGLAGLVIVVVIAAAGGLL